MNKLRQYKAKFIEFKYYVKYWWKIPKGVRRNIIELCIVIGQLSTASKYTSMQGKPIDDIFTILDEKLCYIEEYKDFLKEIQKFKSEDKIE